MSIFAEASSFLPEVVELRRKIHANPELGNHLPETTAAVLESLEGLDLDIRLSERTTSVIATLHGAKPGKRILLRGDMDALPMPEDNDLPFASKKPGMMHACGHDSHTAMLMGAAKLLKQHQSNLSGSVDFFFQTGEEGYFGAREVLEEGFFEAPNAPDAVFAMHITPLLKAGVFTGRPGPLLAAADFFQMTIKGKGGHASMPHDCIDPIPVACEIVQAFQSFVTRRIPAFDPVVLTTTKIEAGTTSNVIPEIATAMGTLRSTSEKSRNLAHEGLAQIAKKVGEAHDCEVIFEMDKGYPVTVNEADFTEFARQTVIDLFGEQGYLPMRSPMMGAEDFSYLLQRFPGAMLFLGVKPEDSALAAPCHSNRMILNEEAMAHGVALHAQVALNFLRS
ncbi:MAG: amidohydrolase [Pseudomonadales bacterium]|nr:amidohydrolase [Pseudomonadales bacterium]MBO6563686.1 amidohydrolase [Pseudomonadales bacterium]MBO6594771.1 amidohydrolase [Pseudomonadales bacterium]MBO6656576.1 amidohydrolase [Pseudomonadales bacterium]MBO6701277.1 amidohydrolase [Pseudomonadales bacterium]